jgi:hypothetical protein
MYAIAKKLKMIIQYLVKVKVSVFLDLPDVVLDISSTLVVE